MFITDRWCYALAVPAVLGLAVSVLLSGLLTIKGCSTRH